MAGVVTAAVDSIWLWEMAMSAVWRLGHRMGGWCGQLLLLGVSQDACDMVSSKYGG